MKVIEANDSKLDFRSMFNTLKDQIILLLVGEEGIDLYLKKNLEHGFSKDELLEETPSFVVYRVQTNLENIFSLNPFICIGKDESEKQIFIPIFHNTVITNEYSILRASAVEIGLWYQNNNSTNNKSIAIKDFREIVELTKSKNYLYTDEVDEIDDDSIILLGTHNHVYHARPAYANVIIQSTLLKPISSTSTQYLIIYDEKNQDSTLAIEKFDFTLKIDNPNVLTFEEYKNILIKNNVEIGRIIDRDPAKRVRNIYKVKENDTKPSKINILGEPSITNNYPGYKIPSELRLSQIKILLYIVLYPEKATLQNLMQVFDITQKTITNAKNILNKALDMENPESIKRDSTSNSKFVLNEHIRTDLEEFIEKNESDNPRLIAEGFNLITGIPLGQLRTSAPELSLKAEEIESIIIKYYKEYELKKQLFSPEEMQIIESKIKLALPGYM